MLLCAIARIEAIYSMDCFVVLPRNDERESIKKVADLRRRPAIMKIKKQLFPF